ncbi:MAG: FMN-binding negative transcriptional regulator [Tepidimonas sp.]|uniref:FMN-binding negative transcriptional regulator n=1 Tax=Tepidimonas sp. TaxID=2002775 RepID=UPI00298F2C40|nr:FMN-binding negative transcriptional regulator [Tepidimonas sp.]MDW8336738.1 FMN-binding negative transcriptional regulator [Tepidimonas sp.]
MYLPPPFRCDDPAIAAELMRAYPFASLISTDDEGLPFVTHLPLHLDERADGWVLLGHVARANPHGRYLQQRPTALVTFLGPHAYLSPRVYPDRQRVPTWNYLAVHCTVQAKLLEAAQDKDALLKQLIADHEPAYAEQWRALDATYTDKMLAGIVAFELRVLRWQCKLKLNQHRPESHAAMRQVYANGQADAQALGRWMDRLGLAAGASTPAPDGT